MNQPTLPLSHRDFEATATPPRQLLSGNKKKKCDDESGRQHRDVNHQKGISSQCQSVLPMGRTKTASLTSNTCSPSSSPAASTTAKTTISTKTKGSPLRCFWFVAAPLLVGLVLFTTVAQYLPILKMALLTDDGVVAEGPTVTTDSVERRINGGGDGTAMTVSSSQPAVLGNSGSEDNGTPLNKSPPPPSSPPPAQMSSGGATITVKIRDVENTYETAEAEMAKMLQCYHKGREGGINYYFDFDVSHSISSTPSSSSSSSSSACRPLPKFFQWGSSSSGMGSSDDGEEEEEEEESSSSSSTVYEPPTDPTLRHILEWPSAAEGRGDGDDQEGRNSEKSPPAKPSSSSSSSVAIRSKNVPLLRHSQWLFDDWRLWEGQLSHGGRSSEDNSGPTPPPLPSAAAAHPSKLVTVARHSGAAPDETLRDLDLYRIDHFCIDEEEGTLIGFDYHEQQQQSNASFGSSHSNAAPPPAATGGGLYVPQNDLQHSSIKHVYKNRGLTEHPRPRGYHTNDIFLHPSNHISIPLVAPTTPPPPPATEYIVFNHPRIAVPPAADGVVPWDGGQWQSVVKASLERYYAPPPASPQTPPIGGTQKVTKASSPAPSTINVGFVEGNALVYPINAGNDNNPSHIYHRIASAAGQKKILNVTTLLFMADAAAPEVVGPPPMSAVYGSKLFLSYQWRRYSLKNNRRREHQQEHQRGGESGKEVKDMFVTPPLPSAFPAIPLTMAHMLALPQYLRSNEEEALVIGGLPALSSDGGVVGAELMMFANGGDEEGKKKKEAIPQVLLNHHDDGNASATLSKQPSTRSAALSLSEKLASLAVPYSLIHLFLSATRDMEDEKERENTRNAAAVGASSPFARQEEASVPPSSSSSSPSPDLSPSLRTSFIYHLISSLNGDGIPRELHRPGGYRNRPFAKYRDNDATKQGTNGIIRLGGKVKTIPIAAAFETLGKRSSNEVTFSMYSSLLATGAEGCEEEYRCAEEEKEKNNCTKDCDAILHSPPPSIASIDIAAHRRCATPYAAIPIVGAPLSPLDHGSSIHAIVQRLQIDATKRPSQLFGPIADAYFEMKEIEEKERVVVEGSPSDSIADNRMNFTDLYAALIAFQKSSTTMMETRREESAAYLQMPSTLQQWVNGRIPRLSPANSSIFRQNRQQPTLASSHQQQSITTTRTRAPPVPFSKRSKLASADLIFLSRLVAHFTMSVDPRGVSYNFDTHNYSRAVWLTGVRMIMREAKRVRRDALLLREVVAARQGIIGDEDDALALEDPREIATALKVDEEGASAEDLHLYGYLLVWRRRLVRCLADASLCITSSSASTTPIRDAIHGSSSSKLRLEVFTDYFNELFGALLERGYDREVAEHTARKAAATLHTPRSSPHSSPPPRPPRDIMCYRQVYISHVRTPINYRRVQVRGSVGVWTSANCHTREVLEASYAAMWQRYGMCENKKTKTMNAPATNEGAARGKKKTPPHLDTSRDAHPLFLLSAARRREMQTLFSDSRRRIEAILDKAAAELLTLSYNGEGEEGVGERGGGGAVPIRGATANTFLVDDLIALLRPIGSKVRERGGASDGDRDTAASDDGDDEEYHSGPNGFFLGAEVPILSFGTDTERRRLQVQQSLGTARLPHRRDAAAAAAATSLFGDTEAGGGFVIYKPDDGYRASDAVYRRLNPRDGRDGGPSHPIPFAAPSSHRDAAVESESSSAQMVNTYKRRRRRNVGEEEGRRRAALRFVHSLVDRVDKAQRGYDDVLMQYFTRRRETVGGRRGLQKSNETSSGAASKSRRAGGTSVGGEQHQPQQHEGRPMRLLQAHRSAKRAFGLFRPMFTRLMAADYYSHQRQHRDWHADDDADHTNPRRTPTKRRRGNDGDVGYAEEDASSMGMTSSIGDYIDFDFVEGPAVGVPTLMGSGGRSGSGTPAADPEGEGVRAARVPLPSTLNNKDTPRARQMHATLTADLLVGTHGADMHAMGLLKPSALGLELGVPGMDHSIHHHDINGGFFGLFGYGRNIGYLRSHVHLLNDYTRPDPIAERGVKRGAGHVALPLPDLRQAYSLAVCGWLTTNAVRLRDEGHTDGEDAENDYSFLVPWWCRGGSSAIVRGYLRQVLRQAASAAQRDGSAEGTRAMMMGRPRTLPSPSSPHPSLPPSPRVSALALAALRPSYYTTRGLRSAYGFVELYCGALASTVTMTAAAAGSTAAATATPVERGAGEGANETREEDNGPPSSFVVTAAVPSYALLIDYQSQCARGLTLGSHGPLMYNLSRMKRVPEHARRPYATRFRVEMLQTLLEAALPMPVGEPRGSPPSASSSAFPPPSLFHISSRDALRAARLMVEGLSPQLADDLTEEAGLLSDVDDDDDEDDADDGGGMAMGGGDHNSSGGVSSGPSDPPRREANIIGRSRGRSNAFHLLRRRLSGEGKTRDGTHRDAQHAPPHPTTPSAAVPAQQCGLSPLVGRYEVLFPDHPTQPREQTFEFMTKDEVRRSQEGVARIEQCLRAMLMALLSTGVDDWRGGAGRHRAHARTSASPASDPPLRSIFDALFGFQQNSPVGVDVERLTERRGAPAEDTLLGHGRDVGPLSSPSFAVHDGALRSEIADWVTSQFMRLVLRPTIVMGAAPMSADSFSYGNNCSWWQ